MTWNELIFELQQIPEERREEKAIFMTRIHAPDGELVPDEGMEIDSKEEVNMDDAIFDCNAGNEETNTTFVIAM